MVTYKGVAEGQSIPPSRSYSLPRGIV